MEFNRHILQGHLADHIEAIFHFKGFVPDHSIERVVPTGHLFIIFELDGFERNTYNNDSLKPNGRYKNVWVSGMHKIYLSISAHQESEMFVIQFKTNGAFPFLKISISELNDRVVSAEEIFDNEILDLRKQILVAETSLNKFQLAESWLLNRFDETKVPSQELLSILEQIKSKPVSDSKDIIASYPNSQKHLISQFKKYFGLTPKVFHRIFRFNAILAQIQNQQRLNWAEIAYEFDYTDQSHFIKEFKEFSGFNPQEFIGADFHKGEPNFFPIDRKG